MEKIDTQPNLSLYIMQKILQPIICGLLLVLYTQSLGATASVAPQDVPLAGGHTDPHRTSRVASTSTTSSTEVAQPSFAQQSESQEVASTMLVGKVVSSDTETPIVGAKVTLANQNISTTTNGQGVFSFYMLEPMQEEVIISASNFIPLVKVIQLHADRNNEMGTIALKSDIQAEIKNEVLLQLSDFDLSDDEGRSQNISSSSSRQNDVFTNHISFAFSPVRFRVRGYDQEFEQTYINGVPFNGLERGMFNYSMIGGLNDATRNKDVEGGIEATTFGYNDLGGSTNILTEASRIAQGFKVGLGATNRNYKGRAMVTYGTGLMENGWAFAASGVIRYSPYIDKIGIIGEGMHYHSGAYFFSAEKRIGNSHRISLVTFGAPTERSQSAALTQEVYRLTNSIYYNPYWGYQNGKMRNSRVVKSFDPTAILSHEWRIDEKSTLKSGVGFHYSMYSNSALTFYNAPDPRPDYYRNLPSNLFDGQIDKNGNFITKDLNGVSLGSNQSYNGISFGPTVDYNLYKAVADEWINRNPTTTQLNWDNLYQANYASPDTSRYMLERRHNNLMETMVNSVYTNQLNKNLRLSSGIELRYSKGMHYKTVDDQLGGAKWVDVDPFAERDLNDLATNIGLTQAEIAHVKQNDLSNPNRRVGKGDRFGYDYDINMYRVAAYVQNEWSFSQIDFYYALKGTLSSFNRVGHMANGRADYLAKIYAKQQGNGAEWQSYYQNLYRSKGQGYTHTFIDPSVKAGLHYKIDGRNSIKANVLAETRAPLARNAYVSQRIHDRIVDNLESSKLLSYDLSYEFNYPIVRGRITGFRTHILNGIELNGYYDDEHRTFVNEVITDMNRIHQGVELGASVKMGMYFTLSAAASIADNHYTSNAFSITSAENGMELGTNANGSIRELVDSVLIKGFKVATGPQLATSLKLSFFHPKMWFADVTVSYFDNNYLDLAPALRMQSLFKGVYTLETDADGKTIYDKNGHPKVAYPHSVLSNQESLVSSNALHRFMVDLSVGKLIYLPKRQSLSINLSVSNLLNNTYMKTGGFQQSRMSRSSIQGTTNTVLSNNVWRFPAKYYYAWGANFFLSATYKF